MDANEIAGLESELVDFLAEFDDCFGRSEPRERLRTYVSGQLSDLPRKSLEPMALAADVRPRNADAPGRHRRRHPVATRRRNEG